MGGHAHLAPGGRSPGVVEAPFLQTETTEHWVEILAGSPAAEEVWTRYRELEPARRDAVVQELKARIDQLVRSDPPSALGLADVLDRAAGPGPTERAIAARGRAVAKHANGRASDALGDYLEAARLHTELGQDLELGRVHRSLVDVYQMSGRTPDALASAELARGIFERLGEQRLLAQLEANLGNVFVRLDDYPTARRHYFEACRLFEDEGDELALAVTRYNLGVTETGANAVAEARQSFRDSSRVFAQHGMRVHTADCDYMLAYLEARRGRFASAIEDLEKARELYADCGKPSGGPLCDLDLAEIFYRIDAYRDAERHAGRAEQAFAELGMDYERAKSALFRSLAHARLGKRGLALEEMEDARTTLTRLGNRAWPAVLEIHRCAIELATSGPDDPPGDRSVEKLHEARAALRAQGLRLWDNLASVALAKLHVARGEIAPALAELEDLEQTLGDREELDSLVRMEQRVVLADVRLAQGDRRGAVGALRDAVDTIERTWSNVPGTDVRTAFFRTRHDAFAQLALLLCDSQGQVEQAFEVLELGRMRSLKDARTWSRPGEELTRARERLDWLLARQLDEYIGPAAGAREGQSGPVTDEEVLAAQKEVARLSHSDDLPLGRSGSRDPVVPRLRSSLEQGEVLVSWIAAERGSRALLVDRNGVRAVHLDATPERLRELGDRLFFQLHKFELGRSYQERHRSRLLASANAVLDELGEMLLAPLVEHLAPGAPLLLVPYGPLHGLPLHALRVADEPLVLRHDVGYALSAFQFLAARADPRAGDGITLVAGDATDLPAIEEEVAQIRARFGAQVHALSPAKLRVALEREAAGAGLLHVSAHGAFQPGHPIFSGLRLGDTFVTAHEVASLDLPFEIVTLSGCETGRLGHTEGEEVFGLNRAFLGAGARNIVSSLWPVDDADCAAFMKCFYDHLARGTRVRGAVCAAQRERLAEDPHPFSWASFTACGDPAARLPLRASKPPGTERGGAT